LTVAGPLSVRARTTLLASAVGGLALVIGAVALVVAQDRSLTHGGDDLSEARVHDLAALAAHGSLPRVLTNVDGEAVGQVVAADGRVLASSPNIVGRQEISRFRPPPGQPVVRTIDNAPDDNETENYRVWAMTAPSPTGPVRIFVGTSLESVSEASLQLRTELLVGVPVMLALLAFLTWLVIGRALRPVEDIRAEVDTITGTALDRRVPMPATDDEVGRLASTMNRMLDRLESASRQQRDFVADASHELQSPIAAVRAELEVAMAHPGSTDWPTLAKSLLADSDQMERLVRDLLFLAREDEAAGVARGRSEQVDLDDLVLQEAARLRPAAAVPIDTARVSAAPVVGDRDELRRLVRNLLENGVDYAATGVRVGLAVHGERVRLEVADDGPGVAAEDRDRVFDRFFRADQARSRRRGGTGLGLAIARAVAERHAGTLTLADTDRGALFVLDLPDG
jgi:signal transduction histidine kinase